MKNLVLALAAAGFITLAGSAIPADARVSGLTTPSVESNTVNARCHHHRRSSRWHCYRRHHHWHAQPFYWQPYHHHHRWHRRWQSRHHW